MTWGAEVRAAVRRHASAGLPLEVWWRDDDAITDTPALNRLIENVETLSIPIYIAAIPAHADQHLVAALAGTSAVPVVMGGDTTTGRRGARRPSSGSLGLMQKVI